MTYEEGIIGIPKQFEYKPELIGQDKIRAFKKIIVLGMGGSRLAADILNMLKPELDIHIHSDYDLPVLGVGTLQSALIIANSYSGNTTEVISGTKIAIEQRLNLAIISSGGELLKIASQNDIPHIALPPTEFQPRMMMGHDLMAIAKLTGFDTGEVEKCSSLDTAALKSPGHELAGKINSSVPLIYTSERLNGLGYIWKIIFDETAKIPAFHNRFPEADHNEIAGFAKDWTGKFHGLFLRDGSDPRIDERMDLTAELFKTHGIPVETIPLTGASLAEKITSSIILSHWTALALAETNNVNPAAVDVIENFKKQLRD